MIDTPVALIVYNRPNLTKLVFNEIRKAEPKELFIISDAARKQKGVQDTELVQKTREIVSEVDWRCTVYNKHADRNVGCRNNVSSGLDWVFSQVEEAVILEDDCLPDPTFFRYCSELLKKYRTDDKVMMISGNNHIGKPMNASYGFCRHSLIWGWATWKRSWQQYRKAESEGFSKLQSNYSLYANKMSSIRLNAIKKTLEGKIDTWDYIWQMAMLMNEGLCIYPCANLVKNEGFGKGATHTKLATFQSRITATSINFPLEHPDKVQPDDIFDKALEKSYQPLNMMWDILTGLILRKSRWC